MKDISYQLYSSREFPPLHDTLSMLANAGYSQVEGFGGVFEDLESLRTALADTGLTMPTGHFGLDMLENEPERVFEIADAAGIGTVFCPFLEAQRRPTESKGWRMLGERLDAICNDFRARGYNFGWHNHDFEFEANTDGTIPMRELFAGGPNLAWEADIAWIVRGGADPLEWIEEFGNRIIAVHIKDIAPTGECLNEDGWADVGYGTMDWASILARVSTTPARYLIMEHDNPSDHHRFATRSMQSVRAMLGAQS